MSDELPKGWVLSTSGWYSNAMKRATAIFRSECIGCQLRISEIDTTESNIRVGMQLKSKG